MTDSDYVKRLKAAISEYDITGTPAEDIGSNIANVLLLDFNIKTYIVGVYGRISNKVVVVIIVNDLIEAGLYNGVDLGR